MSGRKRRAVETAGLASRLRRNPVAVAAVVVLLVLAGSVEERTFGTISDEQQMLDTSISMATVGELGIARGFVFTVHRPAGDALSPYGMAQPLLQLPAALAAERWERAFGAGSSQTLFVLAPLLVVLGGGLAAAALARALGAGSRGQIVALLGATLAGPLWGYTGTNFSEPLQGLLMVAAVLFSVRSAGGGARAAALAAAAGACAGATVLVKGASLAVAPFLLLPLVLPGNGLALPERVRRAALAAAGAAAPLGLWLAFEIVRFGRPLSAYGGQGFSHPLFDGLWRLLVGPNEGLLWYFPSLPLAVAALFALGRTPATRVAAAGIAVPAVILVLLTSAWWSWDGVVGWGPRLLVPAVPLLAAAAGFAAERARPAVAWMLLAAGVTVNVLAVLTSSVAASRLVEMLPGRPLAPGEGSRWPAYYQKKGSDGRGVLPREFEAASQAWLSTLRLHAFIYSARSGADTPERIRRALVSPPWLDAHPADVPNPADGSTQASAAGVYLMSPFRWPRLGASGSLETAPDAEAFQRAYDAGLADQVLRAHDLGLRERGVTLSDRLFELTPSGYSAALHAESLRLAGKRETLAAFLTSLPETFFRSPSLGVVEALVARDAGDESRARDVLRRVTAVFPRPGIRRALEAPLPEWPPTLHAMTGDNLATRTLDLPAVGGS